MKCFKCGYEMPPEALFCPHCGQNHDNTPHFCSKCGNPVDKTMKFCENCGAPIQNATKKEEIKVECPELPVDELVDVGLDVIERLQGDPNSHAQEMHNAKPAQRDASAPMGTPVASEAPAAAGGSAGGAGQKIRRDSASVRDAAAKAQTASAEAVPMQESAAQPQAVATQTQTAGQPVAPVAAQQATQSYAGQVQASAAPQTAAPVQTAAPTQVHTPVSQQNTAASAPVQAAPVQAQTPVQTPVQAPVSQAAPVVPHIPVAPVAPVASATASVATEVAHAAGAAAVAGVKKAGSTAKTVAICAAVVVFIIGAVAACLNFFVPAPEDTVDKLIESVEELKYDDMLSCFDSTTEKQIRAVMGITGDLMGSLTGISLDLEDLMALAPSLAPYMEIPDLGITDAETVLYADCSKSKLMQYCETANSGGSIPTGYLSDNEIVSFLMEYNISLPGLENLIAEVAVVKITLKTGEVGYLPLINEGWGDWRIPMMDLMGSEGLG